jgi:ribosomal protein L3 glutamine methyltransferase
MTLLELIESQAAQLTAAKVSFGHGTVNAFDESAWLVLWCLGLPLDTELDGSNTALLPDHIALVKALIATRISTRKPAAYLTGEAWLQGYAFYADERAIVPRSLIAELLVEGGLDFWLNEATPSDSGRPVGGCLGRGPHQCA